MLRQLVLVLVILAGATYSGWYGRGLHEDSKALSALEAKVIADQQAIARESEIAKVVGDRLDELTASETIIDRGIIREVEKPIYRNVCLDDAAVRMLNAAASGSSKTDTKELASEVSN